MQCTRQVYGEYIESIYMCGEGMLYMCGEGGNTT